MQTSVTSERISCDLHGWFLLRNSNEFNENKENKKIHRNNGSKMYSTMRQNNGDFAGGTWSNKKNNRRKARKIVKRRESSNWKKDQLNS